MSERSELIESALCRGPRTVGFFDGGHGMSERSELIESALCRGPRTVGFLTGVTA